jgi:hypothetical protein
MDSNTVLLHTSVCRVCNKDSYLTVDADRCRRWIAGELIQYAFDNLSVAEREQMISGTHPACWTLLFAQVDD